MFRREAGGRRWLGALVAGAATVLLTGCPEPYSNISELVPDTGEDEDQYAEIIQGGMAPGATELDALQLVKQSTAPDGQGTVEQWLARQVNTQSGITLFPRWKTFRAGPGKYTVTYDYTFIDAENIVRRKGQAWLVDLAARSIAPPRPLTPEELDMFSSKRAERVIRERRHTIPLKMD